MLRLLASALVLLGLIQIGAIAALYAVPAPVRDCYAFIGRDGTDRVFLLNRCDGSVRVLTMPEAPPAGTPNYNKPRI